MLQHPGEIKMEASAGLKLSTAANRLEQGLFSSGRNPYTNTSTPMINPDAVNSQDKMLRAALQPKQDSDQNYKNFENKENVGAKPDMPKETPIEIPMQGVVPAPGKFL